MSLTTAPRPGTARESAVDAERSKAPRTNYRPDIDGIRGTAAIMVMGYHAHVPGFDGSFIGLDLFFVVSGFVITGLLLGEFERTRGIRWSAFYARRARRLIPAKATMLIGVLILSYFVMAPTGVQQDTARSAAADLAVSCWEPVGVSRNRLTIRTPRSIVALAGISRRARRA